MKIPGLLDRRRFRYCASAAAVLLAVTVTGWASPAQAITASYPNPACTIPQGDYYDFYDDCAAYMNWGKYIPDGFIKSGSWFVDLPTKTVAVGPLPELPGLPNVLRINAGLTVESTPGANPADGVFVTYLRCNFTSWYKEYEYLQDSPTGCGFSKQLSSQITFPVA